jgi:hypothetical protein
LWSVLGDKCTTQFPWHFLFKFILELHGRFIHTGAMNVVEFIIIIIIIIIFISHKLLHNLGKAEAIGLFGKNI